MEKPAKEMYQAAIEMRQEEGGQKEEDKCIPELLPSTSFLPELNLLTVFFTSFSLPDQGGFNFVQIEGKSERDHGARARISRSRTTRRDINNVKLMGRASTPRFRKTTPNPRHGRRM